MTLYLDNPYIFSIDLSQVIEKVIINDFHIAFAVCHTKNLQTYHVLELYTIIVYKHLDQVDEYIFRAHFT